MSEPEELGAVDRLVRARLDREIARTDASPLIDRLRAGRDRSVATRRARSRLFVRSVIAASLLIVSFLVGRQFGPTTANAATILRHLRAGSERNVDRCYRSHFAPDLKAAGNEPSSDGLLWTRGDRFRAECALGSRRVKIGRQADGVIWFSLSPSEGVRFADDGTTLPQEIAAICAINSMTVPSLVDNVLKDFDVRADGPASDALAETSLVWARRKAGRTHPFLSAALLEIDARTDTLVRVVLWLEDDGRSRGTVAYTFVESARKGDGPYRLESHVDPTASITTRSFEKTRD